MVDRRAYFTMIKVKQKIIVMAIYKRLLLAIVWSQFNFIICLVRYSIETHKNEIPNDYWIISDGGVRQWRSRCGKHRRSTIQDRIWWFYFTSGGERKSGATRRFAVSRDSLYSAQRPMDFYLWCIGSSKLGVDPSLLTVRFTRNPHLSRFKSIANIANCPRTTFGCSSAIRNTIGHL